MDSSLCCSCKYWQNRDTHGRGVCHKSVSNMMGWIEHGTRFAMRNVKSKKDCKWYKERKDGNDDI